MIKIEVELRRLRAELEEYLKLINKSLNVAPLGSLRVAKCRGIYRFYHYIDGGIHPSKCGNYIRKGEAEFARELAQKDYNLKVKELIISILKTTDEMLAIYKDNAINDVFEKLSEVRKSLVTPICETDDMLVTRWSSVEYTGKTIDDSIPEIITDRGERVRSKSEKIIADKLFKLGIPYKYECPLYLNGYGNIYPDFTLLDVKRREEVYFEHFGMMDNSDYLEAALRKIETYQRNGIYLGERLMVTFETSLRSADMRLLENILINKFDLE